MLSEITTKLQEKTLRFLESPQKMLVNGEWVAAKDAQTCPTVNPANGTVIAEIPIASAEDVDQAVKAARTVFEQEWKYTAPAEKAQLMWTLADLMERDKQVLMELECLDNGKPLEKAAYDVDSAIAHFRYYAGWPTKIEGNTLPVAGNRMAFTRREALGVVGLIVPWNFPIMMAAWKLAPALACGNTCILKPAEQTPLTALYLGKLVTEAGFPAGVVNVVTGPGLPTGEAICAHMDVDKVSFTGSTAVGRRIMETAAKSNLKKVSLELGGKSPNVIMKDADLEQVLESVHWCSFYNSGQECTLGSRLYIQKEIYDQVLEGLIQKASQLTIGNGLENPDLGPMISEQQLHRVSEYIVKGKEEGAELLLGGARVEGALADGYFLPPTIFAHQNDELSIAKEEIFGPVAAVSSFDNLEEIIHRANNTPYGLAAAIWSRDLKQAYHFANEVKAGTIWINGYDMFDAAVPFGGFKESGMGKEMGKSAIDLYTQEKAIWTAL
ncbi:aldehyde dehydrogenase family protein [Algivirga pacifica]|uniref:Aldehyde dehydrogenase DhaS n=1 Tax=Algivirga pacifica TaxID=1162670 RepID=A0ABP9CW07_9BACT